MKRTTTLAIFLGWALLAGTAGASPTPAEDIQAPRTAEVQAPRDGSEDIQAPRGPQTLHDRDEEVQAPRG